MVMDIIVEMTAGAVVIVVESVAVAAVVVTAGLVAAVVIAGLAAVAAGVDKSKVEWDDFEDADLTIIIRNKYEKIILRCYNQKDPSIGKDRKGASVRLQREGTRLLSVRMH
jgi:hypothetical protein